MPAIQHYGTAVFELTAGDPAKWPGIPAARSGWRLREIPRVRPLIHWRPAGSFVARDPHESGDDERSVLLCRRLTLGIADRAKWQEDADEIADEIVKSL